MRAMIPNALPRLLMCLTVVALAAPSAVAQSMMSAAPDKTPLLWDRVRAFDAIVIASTKEGFEKDPKKVAGSNTVLLPVKIEKVLKGNLKPGDFNIQIHEKLPTFLAERDKINKGAGIYLLVVNLTGGDGYLGGGSLYTDLDRFINVNGEYLTTSFEKLVKAFLAAKDDDILNILPMTNELMADEKGYSAAAADHVHQVLTKVFSQPTSESWKKVKKEDLQKTIDLIGKWVKDAFATDTAAQALLALNARTDLPEGVKVFDPALAKNFRSALKMYLEDKPDARTDLEDAPGIIALAKMAGALKDKNAKDDLVKVLKANRWKGARQPTIDALKAILGDEADKTLAPILKELPPENPPPGPGPVRLL